MNTIVRLVLLNAAILLLSILPAVELQALNMVSTEENVLYLELVPNSEQITAFRYQINGEQVGNWRQMEASKGILKVTDFNRSKDVLYIQQSPDGENWSPSGVFCYDDESRCWEKMPRMPVELPASIDTSFVRLFPDAQMQRYQKPCIGIELKIDTPLPGSSSFRPFTALEYRYAESDADWVNQFHTISLSGGLGKVFRISELVTFIPEFGYGVVFHIVDGDITREGVERHTLFTDQQMLFTPRITVAISESQMLLAAPTLSLLFEQGALSYSYGFRIGARTLL